MWVWVATGGVIVLCGWTVALALARAAKQADAAPSLPERTAGMCEYGACREPWSVLVDLGLRGSRYVCAQHVEAVVRENVEPEFEACGVRS
jgi:hypothetical protein